MKLYISTSLNRYRFDVSGAKDAIIKINELKTGGRVSGNKIVLDDFNDAVKVSRVLLENRKYRSKLLETVDLPEKALPYAMALLANENEYRPADGIKLRERIFDMNPDKFQEYAKSMQRALLISLEGAAFSFSILKGKSRVDLYDHAIESFEDILNSIYGSVDSDLIKDFKSYIKGQQLMFGGHNNVCFTLTGKTIGML